MGSDTITFLAPMDEEQEVEILILFNNFYGRAEKIWVQFAEDYPLMLIDSIYGYYLAKRDWEIWKGLLL